MWSVIPVTLAQPDTSQFCTCVWVFIYLIKTVYILSWDTQHGNRQYTDIVKRLLQSGQLTCHLLTWSPLCVCDECPWNLVSLQSCGIQHSFTNYSHHDRWIYASCITGILCPLIDSSSISPFPQPHAIQQSHFWMYLKEMKSGSHRDMCTPMITAALFTTAGHGSNLSVHSWTKDEEEVVRMRAARNKPSLNARGLSDDEAGYFQTARVRTVARHSAVTKKAILSSAIRVRTRGMWRWVKEKQPGEKKSSWWHLRVESTRVGYVEAENRTVRSDHVFGFDH